MSIRIHVAHVYQVDYSGDFGSFGNEQELINGILYKLCPRMGFDGPDVHFANNLDIEKGELANALAHAITHKDEITAMLKPAGYSVDLFIKILCDWISRGDPRNSSVHLRWF